MCGTLAFGQRDPHNDQWPTPHSHVRETGEVGPGGFNYMAARMVHEAWTTPGSVVFITVDGPWDVNWVQGPPTSADVIQQPLIADECPGPLIECQERIAFENVFSERYQGRRSSPPQTDRDAANSRIFPDNFGEKNFSGKTED